MENTEQQVENNNEENETKQVQSSRPVVYSNLLKKLRESNTQTNTNNEINTEIKLPVLKPTKTRGLKNNSKFNSKDNMDRLPRLSKEEFMQELTKCKKLFMNELKQYLVEEIKTRDANETNETNDLNETNETNKSNKSKTNNKEKANKLKMTNLARIQNGSTSVNIIRTICSRNENLKMIWMEKLITNRGMNFLSDLTNFMNKYDITTSYKSPKVILLHSPYLMV